MPARAVRRERTGGASSRPGNAERRETGWSDCDVIVDLLLRGQDGCRLVPQNWECQHCAPVKGGTPPNLSTFFPRFASAGDAGGVGYDAGEPMQQRGWRWIRHRRTEAM